MWKTSSVQVKVVPMGVGISQVTQAALMCQMNQGLPDLSSITRQSSHRYWLLLNNLPDAAGIPAHNWKGGEQSPSSFFPFPSIKLLPGMLHLPSADTA